MPRSLPRSVQQIADVIGRDAALNLIRQLPRAYMGKPGRKSWRVLLYVPQRLRPDHELVRILGWQNAERLVRAFGGELLKPANCAEIYREFRDRSIRRLRREQGLDVETLAQWFGLCARSVRNILAENPQEDCCRVARKTEAVLSVRA